MKRPHKGFTLVELLVVIAIVLVLMGILMPSVAGARRHAKSARCTGNLRANGQALLAYATRNAGKLPAFHGGGAWLWDLPRATRDAFVRSGATRDTMYCPLNPEQNVDGLWDFHRHPVTGYFWLTRRLDGNYPPLAPKAYQANLFASNPSQQELVTDATVSQNGSFTAIQGSYPQPHSTNHLRRQRPRGGNVLFMDGHVEWRPFADMAVRGRSGNGAPDGLMEMWF